MHRKTIIIFGFLALLSSLFTRPGYSQSTEERFQDLFITAGYATAFGAALGAAALSFKENPEDHLRFVAVGASLGFIGGSALGSWIIFSPMFTANARSTAPDLWATAPAPGHLRLSPLLGTGAGGLELKQIQGSMTLLEF